MFTFLLDNMVFRVKGNVNVSVFLCDSVSEHNLRILYGGRCSISHTEEILQNYVIGTWDSKSCTVLSNLEKRLEPQHTVDHHST